MRTDRELLELAAKAAGMQVLREGFEWPRESIGWFFCVQHGIPALHNRASAQAWMPLQNDGDALRLAVQLGMNVDVGQRFTEASMIVCDIRIGADEEFGGDKFAATRRAIVRAAAEIGAASPAPQVQEEGEK